MTIAFGKAYSCCSTTDTANKLMRCSAALLAECMRTFHVNNRRTRNGTAGTLTAQCATLSTCPSNHILDRIHAETWLEG